MRVTLKDSLNNCLLVLKKMLAQRDKWVRDWPGQVNSSLSPVIRDGGEVKCVLFIPQISMLQNYSELIRGNLSKVLRLKVVALVTIEVHARDVIDKLAKAGCNDVNAFEWLCQLRLYWEKVTLYSCVYYSKYGYEYLGNSGRLVITPLTDRSVIINLWGPGLFLCSHCRQ
uniref:Dynein heavy chain hydrolytic ATP-binding dynein motor region domain-containing protein n=1 Tax=Periophthalmus magnuspinnatus TaxID=409849 RepID=A0A3B4BD93_9GOBI